ncbi:ATP-binding protein [bacterium CPR1]|nr:ATP-binding protein [bacterium CPR1]
MTAYHEREIASPLLDALETMPVVVVTGARQVGKSTLLQSHERLGQRRYLTLDDFAQLEAAESNPEALLSGSEPITVDEAQKAPGLLHAIKRMVDSKRLSGRFLLSGSANFALLKGITESLAGRALYLTLHPFTRREVAGSVESRPFLLDFFETLRVGARKPIPLSGAEVLAGGFPPVCLGRPETARPWFRGYEQTYLERDLRELSQVADLVTFRQFLVLTALRTAQVLNVSELARDAHLNHTTASRYLGLLEASFMLRRLGPYLSNPTSRLIKSPKLYMADSGLAAHLAGVTSVEPTSGEPLRGPLFETYVAANLAALLESHWPEARLHYWHVQGRFEVDFVIEAGRQCMAIEVKAATRWSSRDLRSLRAFLDSTPHCRAAILAHNGTQAVQLQDRLWALPLGMLLE